MSLTNRTTDPEYKKLLQQAGLWKAYYTFRDDLKANGVSAKDARLKAMAEFTPKLVELGLITPSEVADEVVASGASAKNLQKRLASGDLSALTEVADRSADIDGAAGSGSLRVLRLPQVRPCDFPDKVATEAENIRWVARNVEMEPGSITPQGCPSPIAWNLLVHILESPQAKADFWKNTYPKLLPSRSQLEEAKPEDFDGQDQIDVISQIQNIVDKVNEGGDE